MELCTICGQPRDDCPSHLWPEMRRHFGGDANDVPGKTGDVADGLRHLT